jgi:protein-S-isoprenylcysteine O-methyltransferase Ste14
MALMRMAAAFLLLPGLLFVPAGTTDYWEAWVYLAILFVPMLFVFVFLLVRDPELLERRMRAKEKEAKQRLVIRLASPCCLLLFLVPGFDRRFGWSDVPVAAVVAADTLVLLGYALFVLVLRQNRYASRVVEVREGQRVVTTGPYAVVRHPMYAAIALMLSATSIALGSFWALLPALLMIAVLIVRICNEEDVLSRELEGYVQYMQRTSYRLVPGVW